MENVIAKYSDSVNMSGLLKFVEGVWGILLGRVRFQRIFSLSSDLVLVSRRVLD